MHDLVVERPVEGDGPLGLRRSAGGHAVDLGDSGGDGALFGDSDVGSLRGLGDHHLGLDVVEVLGGVECLLQAERLKHLPQVKAALVVPAGQLDLHCLERCRVEGVGDLRELGCVESRGGGAGSGIGSRVREDQPHDETVGVGKVHALPAGPFRVLHLQLVMHCRRLDFLAGGCGEGQVRGVIRVKRRLQADAKYRELSRLNVLSRIVLCGGFLDPAARVPVDPGIDGGLRGTLVPEVHGIHTGSVVPGQSVQEGLTGGHALVHEQPVGGVHDRFPRRVVLIHCARVAVELLQRAENRVHGLIAVLRGKLQDAVHLRRGLARRAGAKHRKRNQQAARARTPRSRWSRRRRRPAGPRRGPGRKPGRSAVRRHTPPGPPKPAPRRRPSAAPERRRRTCGERHKGTGRRDPGHAECLHFLPLGPALPALGGNPPVSLQSTSLPAAGRCP